MPATSTEATPGAILASPHPAEGTDCTDGLDRTSRLAVTGFLNDEVAATLLPSRPGPAYPCAGAPVLTRSSNSPRNLRSAPTTGR